MRRYGIGGAVIIIAGVLFTWFFISQGSDRDLSAENVITAREHSAKEVNSHNTQTNCWFSNGGSVYDLTLYFVKYTDSQLAQQLCGQIEPDTKLPTNLKGSNLSAYRIGILTP